MYSLATTSAIADRAFFPPVFLGWVLGLSLAISTVYDEGYVSFWPYKLAERKDVEDVLRSMAVERRGKGCRVSGLRCGLD